jgi:hypothetical protein
MKTSRAEYIKPFCDDGGERQKEALKYAHDIRKFEIDLYWRRAAYFWTFIGAAFAAYVLLQKDGAQANSESIECLIWLGRMHFRHLRSTILSHCTSVPSGWH